MEIGFNLPISGPLSAPETVIRIARARRGAGLRLPDRYRSHRAAQYAGARLSVFRERRILRRSAGTPARAVDGGRFYRRENLPHPARLGGDGGAAPAGRARRQDAVDDRRPIRRQARHRDWRGLASGGIRCGRRHALCRARPGHRPIYRGVQGIVDQGGAARRRQLGELRRSSCSSRSRRKSRIRRSGWAARAGRHCAAPPASATPGIRSAATTSTCSIHCRATAPASTGCGSLTAEAGRDPTSVGLTYRVKRYGEAVPDEGLGWRAAAVFRKHRRTSSPI